MNKVKLTLLTAICIATAFTFLACEEKGKKAEAGGGGAGAQQAEAGKQMTLAIAKAKVEFFLEGTGMATIDWGDGTFESITLKRKSNDENYMFQYFEYEEFKYSHVYTDSSLHTIKITGENITALMHPSSGTSFLDVSENTALTRLDVAFAKLLSSLDISKNTALTYLNCSYNQLSNLDVSKNTALTHLIYSANESGNKLSSLDVSKNIALTHLEIYGNQLSSLDVSKNTALTFLRFDRNKLTDKALNALFKTLHSNAGEKTIYMGENPGTNDCDRSIATSKGWTVEPKESEKIVAVPGLEGCFGFPDENGKRFITKCDDKKFNVAVGKGKIIEIKFSKHQKATENDNGRDTYYNFDNLAGNIFEVTEGELEQNHSSYFLSKKEWAEKALIPLKETGDEDAVDASIIKKIETLKSRKIVKSELLAQTETGEKICLFVFERVKDDMLASLVYVDKDKVIVRDYPAIYDDMSTWRADDGGEFSGIEVLFLAKMGESLLLGIMWNGPEGGNESILIEEKGMFFETEFGGYRYWVPN
jgi:hypothetical protein